MPTKSIDPDRRIRYFAAYCIGLILGYALYFPGRTMPGFPTGGPGDFIIYYTAAQIIRDGEGHRLYDLGWQSQVQQSFLVQHGWKYEGGLLPYVNPPFLAGFLLPLSFVPLALAYHLWNLLGILAVLFCIRTFAQGASFSPAFLLRVVIVFSFFPVFEALWQGQSSFIILLAFTLCYRALKRNAEKKAGIVFALGLAKPQLLLVPVAAFSYLRCWQTLAILGLSGIVIFLLSWILVGTNGLVSYVRLSSDMLNWVGAGGMHPTLMPNLRGTIIRLADWLGFRTGQDSIAPWLNLAILTISLTILVLFMRTWHKRPRLGSPAFDLFFAHMMVCALFLSPHLYGHDLSLLVLAGFLVAGSLEQGGRIAHRNRILCLGHMGFTLPYFFGLPTELRAQTVAVILIILIVMIGREIEGCRGDATTANV